MIEDFFWNRPTTGDSPSNMEGLWNPPEGSKRVHFAGITGLQSRECQHVSALQVLDCSKEGKFYAG